jgi:two-component system chemotaxis response regulator CheB
MVNVLIVDDSPVARQILEFILGRDPNITVIGTAKDGEEAIQAVRDKKPDLVTMDINMPKMNGFDATRTIMESTPVPIIIVTASENIHEVATSFQALEAGAVTLMPRPPGVNHPKFDTMAKSLLDAVKTYAEIKVVRRIPQKGTGSVTQTYLKAKIKIERPQEYARIVAIGASAGGPIVIQTLLSGLKKGFPLPLVIVQHMTQGFGEGFAEWLQGTTGFPIHIATNGEYLLPGHAYIAADGYQMGVANDNRITLTNAPPENGVRPSVSFLFRSVRQVYGNRVIALLLTGMGRDGADELKSLKDWGALTIVQDEQSSVVHGMPGEAIKLGAAMYVLSPEKIVDVLNEITNDGGK